jgi:hypothetical protein
MDDHELPLHNPSTQSVNFVRTSSKQLCDSLEIHGVMTFRTCVRLTDARLRELEPPASSRTSGPVEHHETLRETNVDCSQSYVRKRENKTISFERN